MEENININSIEYIKNKNNFNISYIKNENAISYEKVIEIEKETGCKLPKLVKEFLLNYYGLELFINNNELPELTDYNINIEKDFYGRVVNKIDDEFIIVDSKAVNEKIKYSKKLNNFIIEDTENNSSTVIKFKEFFSENLNYNNVNGYIVNDDCDNTPFYKDDIRYGSLEKLNNNEKVILSNLLPKYIINNKEYIFNKEIDGIYIDKLWNFKFDDVFAIDYILKFKDKYDMIPIGYTYDNIHQTGILGYNEERFYFVTDEIIELNGSLEIYDEVNNKYLESFVINSRAISYEKIIQLEKEKGYKLPKAIKEILINYYGLKLDLSKLDLDAIPDKNLNDYPEHIYDISNGEVCTEINKNSDFYTIIKDCVSFQDNISNIKISYSDEYLFTIEFDLEFESEYGDYQNILQDVYISSGPFNLHNYYLPSGEVKDTPFYKDDIRYGSNVIPNREEKGVLLKLLPKNIVNNKEYKFNKEIDGIYIDRLWNFKFDDVFAIDYILKFKYKYNMIPIGYTYDNVHEKGILAIQGEDLYFITDDIKKLNININEIR